MATTSIPIPEELCRSFDCDLAALFALAVELPGGIALQGQFDPADVCDLSGAISRLLAQLGSALTPLMPLFRLIECVLSAYECIKAIPDALGPPPDPGAIIGAIAKLTKCVDFPLGLVPALTVPALVKTVLNVVVTGLMALQLQLDNLVLVDLDLNLKDALALLLAQDFPAGGALLQASVDCARASFNVQFESAIRSVCPLNALLKLLSLFLSLIGLPEVVELNVEGDLSAVRDAVQIGIDVLTTLRDSIPALITVEGC